MRISYDPTKRDKTLAERGLDFADAAIVLGGVHFTVEDTRQDYGETRFVTAGRIGPRMVVMVWTLRGAERRIISMRKANEREQALYRRHLG